jgi:hypothetical protein
MDKSGRPASRAGHFNSRETATGTHCIGDWEENRDHVDALEKK